MIKANPYLFVENCEEVIEYYRDILKGKIKNVQKADGMEAFKEHEGKYLHAELHLGESIIHFSDIFSEVTKGDNVKITLECHSEDEIKRVYQSLLEGGQVSVELQETFWGALHANVTDKYGIGWLLNYQRS
ncbi:VOC family protein [Halalkalibacter nanhaiisediminis]|uniref:PhnB protein n=1 Tax=Halalkalibacter nanhaiisediminis TaxID=688079 RepID=A0A562QMS9_9BACI|nr:VOC family protein [Halalkalibacter nanhaiisediminis]TWI58049.1 PhnB protein [Halalkalibacter nanhaiisediminis]